MTCMGYELDTTVQRRSNSFWIQLGQGDDASLFEFILDRLNMQSQGWVVDSTSGGILAGMLDWNERDMSSPVEAVWGWGLQSMIKDFPNNVMKIIMVGRGAESVMAGRVFSETRANLDALKGGSGHLDNQSVSDAQEELMLGKTRALISKQPVKPSSGTWEGKAAKVLDRGKPTPVHPKLEWSPNQYYKNFNQKLREIERNMGSSLHYGCSSPGWEAP
ncbi:hypothetical protein AGLY_014167 [Aphis glycines]|uniref:Uncharacterized protein n=1 Tax=Aphis glycines TaxID=307491 RepID=A0A6G0T4H9_APHGL|nr:hypothetical protein AGLY_014167 [Aphis glycines]